MTPGDNRFKGEFFHPDEGQEEPLAPATSWPAGDDASEPALETVAGEGDGDMWSLLPAQPRTLADTGLSRAFLADLTLKTMHYSGLPSATHITDRLALPAAIVQEILTMLTDDHLAEVVSASDLMPGNYRYRLTSTGMERVTGALDRSRYAGPAPVTIEEYVEVTEQQRMVRPKPSRESIEAALEELVLAPEVADALARALHSGRCTLLYGPSGNGKTCVLEAYIRHLEGQVLVPYAIYAHGQIIRVFDSSIHIPCHDKERQSLPRTSADEPGSAPPKRDQRWAIVQRPGVIVGGELGPESLEASYDPVSRFYQAPPHLKAQGGTLVVDDFGRQRVRPQDLLNRWLAPLERGWDSLTFQTGEKIAVPFDVQLLFATNLKVELLLDQAFLRRILYKVEIPNPGPTEFQQILSRACEERGIAATEEALRYVVRRLYEDAAYRPRASYARDLLDILVESARYDNVEPVVTPEAFEKAYRVFLPGRAEGAPDTASHQG